MTVPDLGRSSIYYGSTASGFNVSLLQIQAIRILLQRLAPLCRLPAWFVSTRMAGFRIPSSIAAVPPSTIGAKSRMENGITMGSTSLRYLLVHFFSLNNERKAFACVW